MRRDLPEEQRRPRLLDLFCGDGGAGMGYHLAGFDVVGVDIEPHPLYPFEFHQADALTVDLEGFDAIHASPPCQGYSRMRHLPWLAGKDYPLLIDPIRERLQLAGVPWIIENVEDSPLNRASDLFGAHGVLLCGTMFGLLIYRHRPFETSFPVAQPAHGPHREAISAGRMLGDRCRVPVHRGITAWQAGGGVGGHMADARKVGESMGIDWMKAAGMSQAIPPAYTRHIGTELLSLVLQSDEMDRP